MPSFCNSLFICSNSSPTYRRWAYSCYLIDKTKDSNLKKDISFKDDTFFDILQKKKLQKTSNQK